jgi:hypothetical protein
VVAGGLSCEPLARGGTGGDREIEREILLLSSFSFCTMCQMTVVSTRCTACLGTVAPPHAGLALHGSVAVGGQRDAAQLLPAQVTLCQIALPCL